ncbi:MAG: efflux RND transporter permease subunit, partial [Spongiibacteraceae bacterium]
MGLLRRFLANHVLANLTFVLILVLGALAYMDMPRARDPNINFNWISITTVLPGASSIEVEKRITDPIEDVISRKVKNIRFVSSTSRDGVSNISLRFNEISSKEFEKRTADLRREVQSVANGQLPDQASDPYIVEITSSSGFPTAMVALTAESIDENFRRYAVLLQKELERMPGVDTALMQGIEDPELHIAFYPDRLEAVGVTPAALSATIRGYFNDSSVGDIEMDEGRWMLRLEGTSGSLDELAKFPIVGASGIVPLGKLADIYRTTGEPSFYARFQQQPAVLLSVTKQDDGNTLDIIADINSYIEERNKEIADDGFKLVL